MTRPAEPSSLDIWKKKILVICWIAYTLSYMCRTNLSAVLDQVMVEFDITKSAGGLIGSVFFWTYAVGQVVNGNISERVDPKKMIACGLGASMLINLYIGFWGQYRVMVVLWGLNGFCLSMIWCPVFKILTNWYDSTEYRKIAVYISLPTTIGYVLSWSVLRVVTGSLGWRSAFVVPSMLVAVFLFFWMALVKASPEDAGISNRCAEPKKETLGIKLLLSHGLLFIGVMAVIQGLIKESINLWAPTLLSYVGTGFGGNVISFFSICIPVASSLGIFGVGWLIKRCNNSSTGPVFILFAVSLLSTLVLWGFGSSFWFSIVFISILMAALCGANVILTAYIPMKYASQNASAQISGSINFLIYFGASLGGGISGYAGDRWGWTGLYSLWFALCAISMACVILLRIKRGEAD